MDMSDIRRLPNNCKQATVDMVDLREQCQAWPWHALFAFLQLPSPSPATVSAQHRRREEIEFKARSSSILSALLKAY